MARRRSAPFTNSGGIYIPPFQYMTAGQTLRSPNGRFHLAVQPDGTVTIYDGSQPIWTANNQAPNSSETYNNAYVETRLYNEYQLRLQDGTRKRTWLTASNRPPFKSAPDFTYACLQDDGNLVCLTSGPIWASNKVTFLGSVGPDVFIIKPGTSLEVGRPYAAGGTQLIFQSDGNLVLLGRGMKPIWTSRTENKGATAATMQEDGNFVVQDADGRLLWSTGTGRHSGAYMQIQNNGSAVIAAQNVTWASFGFTAVQKPRKVFYPDNRPGPFGTKNFWRFDF